MLLIWAAARGLGLDILITLVINEECVWYILQANTKLPTAVTDKIALLFPLTIVCAHVLFRVLS